jgi:hypothetical protein
LRLLREAAWRKEGGSALTCCERTEPPPLSPNLTISAEEKHAVRNRECLSHIVGDKERCRTPDELGELLTETVPRWRI